MLALALVAWISCVPVTDWPTPVVEWDHDMATTDGYRVYMRDPWDGPGQWLQIADLSVTPVYDEDEQICGFWRYGDPVNGLDWPVQRGTDAEAIDVEIGVSAYNAYGESAVTASPVFCMPRIWQAGEAYE